MKNEGFQPFPGPFPADFRLVLRGFKARRHSERGLEVGRHDLLPNPPRAQVLDLERTAVAPFQSKIHEKHRKIHEKTIKKTWNLHEFPWKSS